MKKNYFLLLAFLIISNVYGQFGNLVEDVFVLKGKIYFLNKNQRCLPFEFKSDPVGEVYADSLNIPQRPFEMGFPGITNRFEWFAIDYTGKFIIKKEGIYRFLLISDDGSVLYIDKNLVIDNNCVHSMRPMTGQIYLKPGSHSIRLLYFQGPKYVIGLQLKVMSPTDTSFNTLKKYNYTTFKMSDYSPVKVSRQTNQTTISLDSKVLFDFDKFELKEEGIKVLVEIKRIYIDKTLNSKIIIEGHTDDVGDEMYNLNLSAKRAEYIKNWLSTNGVPIFKVETKALGEKNPKFPNTSDENRAKNRRVEIIIIN